MISCPPLLYVWYGIWLHIQKLVLCLRPTSRSQDVMSHLTHLPRVEFPYSYAATGIDSNHISRPCELGYKDRTSSCTALTSRSCWAGERSGTGKHERSWWTRFDRRVGKGKGPELEWVSVKCKEKTNGYGAVCICFALCALASALGMGKGMYLVSTTA